MYFLVAGLGFSSGNLKFKLNNLQTKQNAVTADITLPRTIIIFSSPQSLFCGLSEAAHKTLSPLDITVYCPVHCQGYLFRSENRST
jgi:hypothetical protein